VANRDRSVTEAFFAAPAAAGIDAQPDAAGLVRALARPRRVLLMVSAGAAVDSVLGTLLPLLETGDIVLDGGNSHPDDTARRQAQAAARGLHLLGLGVSGGEQGALWGPSLMPGGDPQAYAAVAPLLEAIAARAPDGAPCVAYLGPGGAGHYVKMVHNGIEYGLMQLIAEAYDLIQRGLGLPAPAVAALFGAWSREELASYLLETAAAALAVRDGAGGGPLVDAVLDQAEQKGTGRWTAQEALELGEPATVITAAVEARSLTALAAVRRRAARAWAGPRPARVRPAAEAIRHALYAGWLCAYAQGFAVLAAGSHARGFDLRLAEVASIWRAGCIIRAALLEDVRAAYGAAPELEHLLLSPRLAEALAARQAGWRSALRAAAGLGVPSPAGSAALAYYDSLRARRLPANLIQALRDAFGAHTYRRRDRDGTFHSDWSGEA
jgi:6-phosphogluconate dehydrogenase